GPARELSARGVGPRRGRPPRGQRRVERSAVATPPEAVHPLVELERAGLGHRGPARDPSARSGSGRADPWRVARTGPSSSSDLVSLTEAPPATRARGRGSG